MNSIQNFFQTKKFTKKKSFLNNTSNTSNFMSYNNKLKANNSLSKYMNNKNIIKKNDKSKNKIHINLYKKPLKEMNKSKTKETNLSKKKDFYSLINESNTLYNSIDEGRKAINNNYKNNNITLINKKTERIKINKNNNYNNKTFEHKLIDKVFKNKNKDTAIKDKKIIDSLYKRKDNKKSSQNNIIRKNNNIKNINNDNDNDFIIGNNVRSKNSINKITQRLFLKETICSKNKSRKNLLYTPKKKINNSKSKTTRLRTKTCSVNSRNKVKKLLTSQYSESRFYTIKAFSPDEYNNKKKYKKRNSIYKEIDYAFSNIKNIKKIYNLSLIKTEETDKNKENKNTINYNKNLVINNNIQLKQNNINKNENENYKNNGGLISKLIESNKQYEKNKIIHELLYHNINSLLSLEIIISESKGIIFTKCPIGHLKKYKFEQFFEKFRSIPDFNMPLFCFICKKYNNLNNFFCGECSNFLCHNCEVRHEQETGHTIISIQNINKYCNIHNKKYIIFCYDCNKNCCELCHYVENKNHQVKTFQEIILDYKNKEGKSINYIKNEIYNQLKMLTEFKYRYKDDLKIIENKDIIEKYFEEYVTYFRNLLIFKEKLFSRYNYNPNNYYNIMNVLNLSLPIFYDYKTEHLFKLSSSNEFYDKYKIINNIISFINNNSIKLFEGYQNYFKFNPNINKSKIFRTIKPSKTLDINNNNKKGNLSYNINNNKYPKQILDLKYNGYFLLLKDKSFDVYDNDLNLIKIFDLSKKFGDSYKDILIGAKLLENKNVAFYNYKKILIVQFSYDFLGYKQINEYDLKINTRGFYSPFNNFDFDDCYEEKNHNTYINKIIDINKNEILSFGIRFGKRYIGSIWNKNKAYDNQIVDINADIKFSIYPIYSVLKYNQRKFATLENNGNHYNVKIYEYKSLYKEEKNVKNKDIHPENKNICQDKIEEKMIINNNLDDSSILFKNALLEKEYIFNNSNNKILNYNINNNLFSKETSEDIKLNIINNNIKNYKYLNNTRNYHINTNRYENDDYNITEDSEENIDKLLEEIKINTLKREEEYLKAQVKQKQKDMIVKKVDNIPIKKINQFNEVFELKYIQFKTEGSSPEEIIQQIILIKINKKLFGFLDKENIVIINFETCEVVTKILYGYNKLIYIDKTPNNNFLFKENNKIISYNLKDNDLVRINLPVFEYNENEKNISSWFLISGRNEFINKAKIIDDKFMISLFELRIEKWNLNTNFK